MDSIRQVCHWATKPACAPSNTLDKQLLPTADSVLLLSLLPAMSDLVRFLETITCETAYHIPATKFTMIPSTHKFPVIDDDECVSKCIDFVDGWMDGYNLPALVAKYTAATMGATKMTYETIPTYPVKDERELIRCANNASSSSAAFLTSITISFTVVFMTGTRAGGDGSDAVLV